MDWLKLVLELLASLKSIANAFSQWLAKQAGIDAEKRKQAEADADAARKRDEVEDANSKLSPDTRRDELSKWVRDDGK